MPSFLLLFLFTIPCEALRKSVQSSWYIVSIQHFLPKFINGVPTLLRVAHGSMSA